MTPGSDVSLVVRMTRGDRSALAVVFERHGSKVHGLAAEVCGPRLADAVTALVFLQLSRHPDRFKPDR